MLLEVSSVPTMPRSHPARTENAGTPAEAPSRKVRTEESTVLGVLVAIFWAEAREPKKSLDAYFH